MRGRLMVPMVVLASALLAPPARAGWSPAAPIGGAGSGSVPVLAFGPNGDAAVVSEDGSGATYLVRRAAHGTFSVPVTIAGPGNEFGPQEVLLPRGGDIVLLVGGAPWDALVQPPSAGMFAAPQQLAPPDEAEAMPTNAAMVATANGEVIAVLDGDSATVGSYTMTLPGGASSFGAPEPGSGGRPYPGPFALAADGVGGAFLAWPGTCGTGPCVSYRRARGVFRRVKGLSRPPGCKFDCIDAVGIGAAGDGYAALGEVFELVSRGAPRGRVAIQVGRGGSMGPAHVLATTPYVANTELVSGAAQSDTVKVTGPIVDQRGRVTIAWKECGAEQLGCSIGAALGDVHGRYGPSQTLASIPRGVNVAIDALVGDGVVAVQRCRSRGGGCDTSGCPGGRCSIGVVFAGHNKRFVKPQRITADGQLELLVGDAHADQLLVWKRSDGSIHAAISTAGSRHFGPPRQLSAAGRMVDPVTGAFGPMGEAIVAWAAPNANALTATVYQLPH